MKLTTRQIDDLLTLIEHTRTDLSYGEGGSFNYGEGFDEKDAKKAERAIAIIKQLIILR